MYSFQNVFLYLSSVSTFSIFGFLIHFIRKEPFWQRTCLQRNCGYKYVVDLTETWLFLQAFSFNKELHCHGRTKVIWTSAKSDNSCSRI